MYDLNDVEPQRSGELIPDGTFAKVTMAIRPGGVDGQTDLDKGLLKASNAPGSDVLSLDAEFTVVEGPHARRKFWQLFTVSGGKVDEKGVSIGWNISKRIFRAMVDSALGLDPEDMSDAARSKRQLRGLADLNGITFVAKIMVEPNSDPRYADQNKLDRAVLPNEKGWRAIMDGQDVPPSPSRKRTHTAVPGPQQPAWNQNQQPPAPAGAQPAWQANQAPTAPQPAQAPAQAPAQSQPPAQGPAWLNS